MSNRKWDARRMIYAREGGRAAAAMFLDQAHEEALGFKGPLSQPHEPVREKPFSERRSDPETKAALQAAVHGTVEVKPLSPEQEAAVHAERQRLRIAEALRSQDPMAGKTTNASLHVVKTPGGVAAYHADRQRAALEAARGMRGSDRTFAMRLAREHGALKRDARGRGSDGQPRVPAGSPDGGQWTKG